MTGEAFTFYSPAEEPDIRSIEKAISKKLPRVSLEGFDYSARPEQKLEIPLADRIAQIRKKKAEDRARSAAKAARKTGTAAPQERRSESPYRKPGESSGSRSGPRRRRGPR
jgi:ATP-dependent RNA helicase RhlE